MQITPGRIKRPSMASVAVTVAALLLLTSLVHTGEVDALAVGGQAQVWGQTVYDGVGYKGADAYVTTPNPNISAGWAGGPTGVSDIDSPPFIESGPTKACDRDCGLHPYASWINTAGAYGENVVTNRSLASGGQYRYYQNYVSDTHWQAVWCDGVGCGQIGYPDLGASWGLHYAASGGESSCGNCPIGSLRTSYNRTWVVLNGGWQPWCYDSTRNNVGGYISGCGANNDWSISYP